MSKTKFENQSILVLGLGLSGRAAANLLLCEKAKVVGVDSALTKFETLPAIQALIQQGARFFDDHAKIAIENFDLMILSPGIAQNHPLVLEAKSKRIPIMGEMQLGCQFIKNCMIGITGTNGKTTVTNLITHVLQQNGLDAIALGNVGIPVTEKVKSVLPSTILATELSSYQLETLQEKVLDSALILNLTPDHLDRYEHMEAYVLAKMNIAHCLKEKRFLYVQENAWDNFTHLFPNVPTRLYGYRSTSYIYTNLVSVFKNGICQFELPLSLSGCKSHELENLLAAYAACSNYGIDNRVFLDAWKIFKKPAHRLEFVTAIEGVNYYDDSKGTNVDAVIRAVESLEGPIVLIAGGVDKGFPFYEWIEKFNGKVTHICAIGQAAEKIHLQLNAKINVKICNSLEEAVKLASTLAQTNGCVLLSPGCASFDMFKDYSHRGDAFQLFVRNLKLSKKGEMCDA